MTNAVTTADGHDFIFFSFSDEFGYYWSAL